MRTVKTDVAIIGGGVIGCGIAFYLAKKGIDVVVLEASSIAAMGSGRSLGALRSQGRDLDEMPLVLESHEIFPTLNDEFGYDTEYRKCGHLMFVFSEDHVSTLETLYQRQSRAGYEGSKLVSSEEIHNLVPSLPKGLAKGMYCASDGDINPMRMNYGYFLGAKKWGAKIFTHTPVKGIRTEKGRVVSLDAGDLVVKSNWVVNAAGVHAREISKWVGIDLPIISLVYEMLVTEPVPPFLSTVLQCPEKKFGCRQVVSGNILFGSSVPNDLSFDMTVLREKFKERVSLMRSIFVKNLRDVSILRSFVGLFDITPDLLPIIDCPDQLKGYVVAAGFSGHGLAIGPAVSNRVAEWIRTGIRPSHLEKLSYGRFAAEEITEFGNQKGKYSFMVWTKPKLKEHPIRN